MIKKYKLFFVLVLCIIASIFLPTVVNADITPGPAHIDPWMAIYSFLLGFMIYYVINGVILIICFLILKQGLLIKNVRFLLYNFLATVGGIMINGLIMSGIIIGKYYFNSFLTLIMSLIIIFVLLFIFNYLLARKFYNFSSKQALTMGIFLGILTNIETWGLIIYSF